MPKALVPLGHGQAQAPIVTHALRSVLASASVTDVVVVAPSDAEGMQQVTSAVRLASPTCVVVPGGAERSDSVARGLAALPDEVGIVLVHDAARALTPSEVFDRVVEHVRDGHAAVTPALPVADTIKQVDAAADGSGEVVVATVDRATLRAVQTPQGFLRETLERAHAEISQSLTDDCGMVEALGGTVHVVPGDPRAMKITTPHDLEVAAAWLPELVAAAWLPESVAAARVAESQAAVSGPVLVVLSGLPGVGKTAVARAVCSRLGAAHLRVDTVEQTLLRGGLPEEDLAAQGYTALYGVAQDQLAVGLSVVADLVNGIAVVREAWDQVAAVAGARALRVVLECSDEQAHRQRVEGRAADIEGHRLPTWDEVREREFEPWGDADLVLDTAYRSAEETAQAIVDAIARTHQERP